MAIFKPKISLLWMMLGLVCIFAPSSHLKAVDYIPRAEVKTVYYLVYFKGIKNGSIVKSLKNASDLERLKTKAPGSLAALRHRAYNDIPALIKVMHGYGYYEACITTDIKIDKNDMYRVTINVNPGPDYSLKHYDLIEAKDETYPGKPFNLHEVTLKEIGIKLNKPANSKKIVGGENKLLELLAKDSYPLAFIKNRKVVVDQAKKTVNVTLDVDTGPQSRFGKVEIIGVKKVNESYVRNRISWKEGHLYSPSEVKRTQNNLYETGLFSTVNITHGPEVDENGYLKMYITVTEGKHSSITLGATYHTTWEGFGGIVGWQNRNIFGSAINFGIDVRANQKKQQANLIFSKPDFVRPDQTFVTMFGVKRDDAPNYLEKSIQGRAFVERIINRMITMSLGLKFDEMLVDAPDQDSWFSILGTPYHFNFQTSENLLINPIWGTWWNYKIAPYISLTSSKPAFLTQKLAGAFYIPLVPGGRLILAQSAVFGMIVPFGPRMDIPPPYRFYAGSEHHLRGYPYQSISPLDSERRPIGGRSMFLYSVEPRLRITDHIEVVGFLDVGNVYVNTFPRLENALVKSLGVGARYLSFIGPLRLDIGFPLNRRDNVREKLQIYFSIGQAF